MWYTEASAKRLSNHAHAVVYTLHLARKRYEGSQMSTGSAQLDTNVQHRMTKAEIYDARCIDPKHNWIGFEQLWYWYDNEK